MPELGFDIERVITEGDLDVLHHLMKTSADDPAVVDVFRVEDGGVVEHWDVLQPVPAETADDDIMFQEHAARAGAPAVRATAGTACRPTAHRRTTG